MHSFRFQEFPGFQGFQIPGIPDSRDSRFQGFQIPGIPDSKGFQIPGDSRFQGFQGFQGFQIPGIPDSRIPAIPFTNGSEPNPKFQIQDPKYRESGT
ncbi:MAG: hypothetical protein IPK58_07195 [Acidobacteria bacterium]|nr:hypothetical protein [Acidobacteriota bacterium]